MLILHYCCSISNKLYFLLHNFAKYLGIGQKAPRIASNGNRLPDPLPCGSVLTDVMQRKWKLGKSIGIGGFGEIYLGMHYHFKMYKSSLMW